MRNNFSRCRTGPPRPRPIVAAAAFAATFAAASGGIGPGAQGPWWALGAPALAQTPIPAEGPPLSAIDWLSRTVSTPVALPRRNRGGEAPANPATPPRIDTRPLGAPEADAAGVLPSSVTGLPPGLWGSTPTADLIALIDATHVEALPAAQDLLYSLLLAELDPPFDAAGQGRLLLARIDKLLALGALDQARALIEVAGADSPEVFRRWFDIALLLGEEDRACAEMETRPGIAPTFKARVFCLARGGDWSAAALSLRTGEALGYVTGADAELMTHFLDPEMFEGEPVAPPPDPMTPLSWRLLEAIGEAPPTNTLPVAFAQADLRGNIGWKARIEAAERLARLGAAPGNLLWGLYTEGRPAASGGVWDRVSAAQALDRAMAAGDAQRIGAALRTIWPLMQAMELEVPFAELYGARLQEVALTGETARLAFHIGLLSADYEEVAVQTSQIGPDAAFLRAIARGDLADATPSPGPMARAVLAGLTAAGPSAAKAELVSTGRLGEAVLRAMDDLRRGAAGNAMATIEGLALLRHVGLEDAVRRAALQLMLLDRRG